METVSIVGVGLIGGSFALALREAGFNGKIIGVSSPQTTAEALRLGVIDEELPLEQAAPISDLIYLAQPISRILDTITKLDAVVKPGALITDAGSTKTRIVGQARRHIRRAYFLGGHPMAGKEVRGVSAAEAGLFRGRTYILTPDEVDREAPQVQEFVGWVRRIGANDLFLAPEVHDRVIAFVSHVPQMASTGLAAMLAGRADVAELESAAGPGLLDMTRLAMSDFEIWGDILATNLAYINEGLSSYIEALQKVQADLVRGGLEQTFEAGAAFASRLRKR